MSSSQPSSITNGSNSPIAQNNDDNLKYNCVAIRQGSFFNGCNDNLILIFSYL